MALETLKGVKVIDGFKVVVMDDLKKTNPEMFNNNTGQMDYKLFEEKIRPNNFIYVRHDVNSISFTLQNGPVKENGVNGCQVDTLIEVAKIMIKELNKKFPCWENEDALDGLETAAIALKNRKHNRELRGVEGFSKK